MITIDKGVPMPAVRGRTERIYPFDAMQPGDSFAVPVPDGKTVIATRARLTGAAHMYAKRYAPGAKFTTRAEDGDKSVRIWLLSKPVPLAPLATSTPRVVRPLGADDDELRRRGPNKTVTKPIAFDIPKFADGGKATRTVKGSRY